MMGKDKPNKDNVKTAIARAKKSLEMIINIAGNLDAMIERIDANNEKLIISKNHIKNNLFIVVKDALKSGTLIEGIEKDGQLLQRSEREFEMLFRKLVKQKRLARDIFNTDSSSVYFVNKNGKLIN